MISSYNILVELVIIVYRSFTVPARLSVSTSKRTDEILGIVSEMDGVKMMGRVVFMHHGQPIAIPRVTTKAVLHTVKLIMVTMGTQHRRWIGAQ